ncbi:MAG TPA: hypothetical protein VEC11_10305 [Allosphingosinicella sp.]|nr:hypothetical protein [Allosphingosinicella sp.]
MSGRAPDPRLDALLRDLPPAPPVPAGLAARVLEAAAAAPQEPRVAHARRAAARRDRRGRWLRRPLLAGTVGLGLVFTSAVAATLAGVPIPQKIAAVFFAEEKAPEPKQAEPPRRAAGPAATPAAPVQTAAAGPKPEDALYRQPGPWRRLFIAQRIIDARRAMGLPTPGADRIERRLRRRAERWQEATPEQRAEWLQRQHARREARRAALATPEGREAFVAQQDRMRRWRAQQRAGLPLTPGQRAAMREWRERRMAGMPPTPEERAARRERMREWRAQRQAGMSPLTEEERTVRQERFRRWREARRERWQARQEQVEREPATGPEASGGPSREGETSF